MCVISLAKLRGEDVETVGHLVEQLRQSKVKKELSIDVLDYMCDIARDLEITAVKTAFGVKEISDVIQDFDSVSLDSL